MASDDAGPTTNGPVTVRWAARPRQKVARTVEGGTTRAATSGAALPSWVKDAFDSLQQFSVPAPPDRPSRGAADGDSLQVDVDVPAGRAAVLLVRDGPSGRLDWVFSEQQQDGSTRGGGGPVRFAVPFETTGQQAERGVIGAVAKKVISVLLAKAEDVALAKAGEALARRWEEHHRTEGPRWLATSDLLPESREATLGREDQAILRSGRSLLVLHDVLDTSRATIGRFAPGAFAGLALAYGSRVWGFDHHTLTVTPDANADAFMSAIEPLSKDGDQVVIDILAHGRGGLVAREIVARLLPSSPIAVRSITFVGTPNDGTPLCDVGHLDRFVSRFTNLLTFLPDNPATDTLDALLAVVRQVLVGMAGGLRGVTAMAAVEGGYLEGLNARTPPTGVGLRGISADYAPGPAAGVGARLVDFSVDKVFGNEPNDVIVPTQSVFEAGGRDLVPIGARLLLPAADAVDHATCWGHPKVMAQLLRWAGADASRGAFKSGTASTQSTALPEVARRAREQLEVRVVHGSLEYASYPVIVGHAEGDTLTGAEAYVDARLGGLLSTRQLIGQYPSRPGDAIFFHPRRDAHGRADKYDSFPPGAYVIGLGPSGELKRAAVTDSVRAAIVARGIEFYEQLELSDAAAVGRTLTAGPDGEIVRFGVASVLVGAYPVDGLPVELSLVAIVEGILAANDDFERYEVNRRALGRSVPNVRVAELEVIERYADRAELAAYALNILPRLLERGPELNELVAWQGVVVEQRAGGLPPKPHLQDAETAWRRILVTLSEAQRRLLLTGAAPPSTLELDFTVLGRLARADRLPHLIDRRTVDKLVENAIADARPESRTAATLYELLIPLQLKEELTGASRAQLVVDELTSQYPWEVMTARAVNQSGEVALSRLSLLRQFRESSGQRFGIRRAFGWNVLVVGNPPVRREDYPDSDATYPDLPGAEAEAHAVRERFEANGDWNVVTRVWGAGGQAASPGWDAPGREILNCLFEPAGYRIVHVAAHGVVADDPAESGAVIGDGMYLTANVIRQLSVVPDVVFLNCCYLAQVGFNRLAAGVARELMAIGVRAVVAAGWPVDDQAAKAFAEEFYEVLLAGHDFGDAVGRARAKARETRSASLTWGAYQCYGDPGFRLDVAPGGGDGDARSPVSRRDVLGRIRTIAVNATDVGRADFGRLAKHRKNLVEDLGTLERAGLADGGSWSDPSNLDGEVCYELGRAYADLGDLERGVFWWRRALDAESGYPRRLFEQLANIETRLAHQRPHPVTSTSLVPDTRDELLTAALAHLDEGTRHDPSEEEVREAARARARRAQTDGMEPLRPPPGASDRYSIRGSLTKKTAVMTDDASKRAALVAESARYYETAHLIEKLAGRRDPYSTLNWLQLAGLAGRPRKNTTEAKLLDEIDSDLGRARASLEGGLRDRSTTPTFWDLAGKGDVLLTKLMRAGGATRQEAEDIANAYRQAFELRSSWKERDSVLEHLRDLRTLAQPRPGRAGSALRVGDALDLVLQQLDAWDDALVGDDEGEAVSEARGPGAAPAPRGARADVLRIEMLPAAYGDALIVEYGRPNDLHRILIDGGPAYSYAEGLGAALARLPEDQREFELLVVSHIDADHIEGGIMVMRHGLARFKDIWFNGWKHLEPERGAVQGEMLDALIPPGLWNLAFSGQAAAMPDTGELPVVELEGGARLTLLSPGHEQLRRLRKAWTSELDKRDLTPGDADAALQLLDERPELAPATRGGAKVLGGDTAPANGSSIAFLLEVGQKSVLLGADAHAPVLAGALRRLAEARGTSAIRLDAFKLPHHGSAANVSEELLQLVDCNRFLVSTNGAKFKHPDEETIELIGHTFGSSTGQPLVVFNYRSTTTTRWLDPAAQAKANIVARFPPATSSSMVVEL